MPVERLTKIMMQADRLIRQAARWILILLSVLALNPLAAASDKNLLHRATRVRGLHNWSLGLDEPDRWQAYGWLSDHEMLFFRYPKSYDPSDFAIWTYDLNTHKYHYLRRLSERFVDTHGNPLLINISPDGKWILWEGRDDGPLICGSAVDGSHPFHEPLPSLRATDMYTFWLSDSRYWIDLFSDPPLAFLYDPRSRRVVKKWPISRRSLLNDDSDPVHAAIVEGKVVSEQHMLLPVVSYHHPEAHILDLDLTAGGTGTHTYTIHFPPATENAPFYFVATISPRGDRVAWQLDYTHGAHSRYGLWVSNVDGSSLHEVGHLDMSANAAGVDNIEWLPDGKHISFTYKDNLYIVPAG